MYQKFYLQVMIFTSQILRSSADRLLKNRSGAADRKDTESREMLKTLECDNGGPDSDGSETVYDDDIIEASEAPCCFCGKMVSSGSARWRCATATCRSLWHGACAARTGDERVG
eukprot:156636_1